MANRVSLRDDIRLELGDPGGSGPIWTGFELNRAIDEVTADFSRLIPQEKIREDTIDFAVTFEDWNAIHDTIATLANKPIEFASESVKTGFGSHMDFATNGDFIQSNASGWDDLFDGGNTIEVWVYIRSNGEDNTGRIIDKSFGSTVGWLLHVSSESGTTISVNLQGVFSITDGQ